MYRIEKVTTLIAIKARSISILVATMIAVLVVPYSPANANGLCTFTSGIQGVTPPVAGATPVETITATTEYTGTVEWYSGEEPLIGNFETATIYIAIITLVPVVEGCTFDGVAENFFIVDGASSVSNSSDSGIITAIFLPATGDATRFLDGSFSDNGSISIKDIFGENPINESGTVICPIKVDEIASDSQNRIVVLAAFYAQIAPVARDSTANRTAIGTGYMNSREIVDQAEDNDWQPEAVAAFAARRYESTVLDVRYDDWYLPSRDELDALYEEREMVGPLLASSFWSSSEHSDSAAYYKSFINGHDSITCKGASHAVRPIRAGDIAEPIVGAPGEGGGEIFYVSTEGFSCGPTLEDECNYLEVAPNAWFGDWQEELYISWSGDSYIDNHILFRLNPDGSYDNNFGSPETFLTRDTDNEIPKNHILVTTTGRYYISEELGLEIDSDDKILVSLSGFTAGDGNYHNFLARYTSGGILDESFGDEGDGVIGDLTPQEEYPERLFHDFALDADGGILVASLYPETYSETFTTVVLERFHLNGLMDSDFGSNGSISLQMSYPNLNRSFSRVLRVIADDAGGYIVGFTGAVFIQDRLTSFTQLVRIQRDGTVDNNFTNPFVSPSDENSNLDFYLTDLAADGDSGFLMSGTFVLSESVPSFFGLNRVIGLTLRFKMNGAADTDFIGFSSNPQLNPLVSQSCVNTALLRNESSHQSIAGVLSANFCSLYLEYGIFDYGSLRAFASSGEYQGEFYLGVTPDIPDLQFITQLEMTRTGKILVLNGARPKTGFFRFFIEQAAQPEEGENFWTNATISRYLLPEAIAPLTIEGPLTPITGTVGVPINPVTLAVTGGTGTETVTVTSDSALPAGLTVSTAGVISGTPIDDGNTTTSFTVTDSLNETATTTVDFRISLATTPPAQAPIPAPPPPVPYLNTLTAPKIQLKEEKLICTPGTYNAGYTIGGVNQGSSTSLFTPTTFTYNLFVNGVQQNSLTVISTSATASWSVPTTTTGALITCSVTVSANGVTNTDRSSDNTAGVNEAAATQRSAIAAADSDYLNSLSANAKAYQKALIDNRAKWRSDNEKLRSDYHAERDRIRTLPSTRATRALASAAFKRYVTAQKQNASDYAASKPAALAAKDVADKAALDTKNLVIKKANATFSIFIESIGYGVLIP